MDVADLITEIAATHNISTTEAVDEVWDAIEILFAPEDQPQDGIHLRDPRDADSIREYIAEQYRTNRTRL
jgi:hypothetical protein